jgi:hypothetical protein
MIGCFLINALKAMYYMACSGWQTPYPQKRQQTLGATSSDLWKTAQTHDKSGFQRSFLLKNSRLIIFQPSS